MDEKKARRLKFWRRAVGIQVFLIFSVLLFGAVYGYAQLSKIKIVKISKKDEDLGITRKQTNEMVNDYKGDEKPPVEKIEYNSKEPAKAPVKAKENTRKPAKATKPQQNPEEQRWPTIQYSSKIKNIALFGVDKGREKWEAVHSDAIMILSIDEEHNKIKLSSIMRDSYVSVDGHGRTKITNAYAYGGPQLAIKTLNKNFNLDIREFVAVDFMGLGSIIDSLGGIRINVKASEINEVNKYMREVAQIRREEAKPIREAGSQILDGNQGVAFARIRAVGNGDYKRTERQQEVLTAIINRIHERGRSSYLNIITELLPYVETSMSRLDMISMGGSLITSGKPGLDWVRFPTNSNSRGKMINKGWYLTFDRQDTIYELHRFIYEGVKPGA